MNTGCPRAVSVLQFTTVHMGTGARLRVRALVSGRARKERREAKREESVRGGGGGEEV